MASKKAQDAIAADDVPRVFDDACIDRLAAEYLPDGADRQRFAEGIREAARIYAVDARKRSTNAVGDEVEKLHQAATQPDYEQVVGLLEVLSPEVRRLFEARETTPGFINARLKMPSAEALRDPARREAECDVVRRFCSMGMGPRGKPLLCVPERSPYAPEQIMRPPKRKAERQFVMHLRLAWFKATATPPPATVNPTRPNRPFVNFVRECLALVGAPYANAVKLINELNRQRNEVTRKGTIVAVSAFPPSFKR
jgi:hypothetical protein